MHMKIGGRLRMGVLNQEIEEGYEGKDAGGHRNWILIRNHNRPIKDGH